MITVGTPKRISATGLVTTSSAKLLGVLCNSSAAGTITLDDSFDGASGAPFANAIPMVAGAYLPIPATVAKALFCTIGGAADVTFFVA